MKVLAPAKINLHLSVGPRRADGRHELITVFQSVELADELSVEPGDRLSLAVEPPGAVEDGDDNLALRAARALADATGVRSGARLVLRKRIPVAAGLAGGSADAAAALVGLNELWGCRMSRKALEGLGAALGADVPFCVRGGTAVGRGAGEILSPLVSVPLWWAIAMPEGSLPTARVYEEFDRLGGPGLEEPADLAGALARGDLDQVGALLRNDLEPAALSLLPALAGAREALIGAGALAATMSGSGPSWLALARDEAHAREIAGRAAGSFARVEIVRSLERGVRVLRERSARE